jgi:hypothetical protein
VIKGLRSNTTGGGMRKMCMERERRKRGKKEIMKKLQQA